MSQWAREHPDQDYDAHFEAVREAADNERKAGVESPHIKDEREPCGGCGARWDTATQTIEHAEGCAYIAAFDAREGKA